MTKRLLSVTAALVMMFSLLSACSAKEQQPLPAYFSLADEGHVSSGKCQNSTSLCWDYASISTAESAILTAGLAESVDLSEGHLYFIATNIQMNVPQTALKTECIYGQA